MPAPARLSVNTIYPALLFSGAVLAALYFNGLKIPAFALCMLLLLFWWADSGRRLYARQLSWPQQALFYFNLLFLLWLMLNAILSQVRYLSLINFWWIGALSLTYLAFTLRPDKEVFWLASKQFLLLLATVLAGYALVQYFLLQQDPRATFINHNSLAAFLNLFSLPLAASLLLPAAARDLTRWPTWSIAALLFLLVFVTTLTTSRAATAGFLIGLALLLVVAWRHVSKRRLLTSALLPALAILTANLINQGGLTSKLARLGDPEQAGAARRLIWEAAWTLLQNSPWYGTGSGTFWMAWRSFRHPGESSAGFYAHNDYLQLAIETGWPGLLLFLGILLSLGWLVLQALRRNECDTATRLQLTGLFAALLAVALHSFFSFNLYILPLMLVAGLWLGRCHQLAGYRPVPEGRHWDIRAQLRPAVFYACFGALLLLPAVFFITLAAGDYVTELARQEARKAKLEQAHRHFMLAQQLTPYMDNPFYMDADLLRRAARQLNVLQQQERNDLKELALQLLDDAKQRNPLRPQTAYIRGRLYTDFLKDQPENLSQAIAAYETALRLDPRFLPARTYLARLLLARGQEQEALQVLLAGIEYNYRVTAELIDYTELTVAQLRRAGDIAMAENLQAQMAEIREELRAAGSAPKP